MVISDAAPAEPGTLVLLGAGLLAVGGGRDRSATEASAVRRFPRAAMCPTLFELSQTCGLDQDKKAAILGCLASLVAII